MLNITVLGYHVWMGIGTRIILLGLIFCIGLTVAAKSGFNGAKKGNQRAQLQTIVNELKQQIPSLRKRSIEVIADTAQSSTFQARWTWSGFFLTGRNYGVFYNPKRVALIPNEKALRAVLVHELGHLAHYEKLNRLEYLAFGYKYLTNKKFARQVERQTDLFAVAHGGREGLIIYRHFLVETFNESPPGYLTVNELTLMGLEPNRLPSQTASLKKPE